MITTAKEGGLRIYDLDGAELQSLTADPAPRADGVAGRYNNVDIAYGLDLGAGVGAVDVAVVSDRYNDQLRFFAIDPAGAQAAAPVHEITAAGQPFLFSADRDEVDDEHTAYGLAVWQPAGSAPLAVVTPGRDHDGRDRGTHRRERACRLSPRRDRRLTRHRFRFPTARPGSRAKSPASSRSSKG